MFTDAGVVLLLRWANKSLWLIYYFIRFCK